MGTKVSSTGRVSPAKRESNFATVLVCSTLFVLCYWPTYFITSIPPPTMQKSFFFVMLCYLLLVTLAIRAPLRVPNVAYVFVLPFIPMVSSFLFNIDSFGFFHISVLIKPMLLFLLVSFFYSIFTRVTDPDFQFLYKSLEIILLLQVFLVALQIIFGDVAWLKIMSFRQVYEGLTFRAPGSMDWVYSTCYFLTFFLTLYLVEFFLVNRKAKVFILLLLIFAVVFLSQSKTGYIATIVVMLYFVFLAFILKLGIVTKLSVTILLGVLFIALLLLVFDVRMPYIFNFFELLISGKMDGSTATRTEQTLQAVNEGLTYWYSGSPSALKGVVIENAYLDYLFRYGVVGAAVIVIMIILFYLYSFVVMFRARILMVKTNSSIRLFQLAISCHITFFAVVFYSFSGTPLDGYRSAIWSSFLVALVACLDFVIRKKRQQN